jgi:hypothetical protein
MVSDPAAKRIAARRSRASAVLAKRRGHRVSSDFAENYPNGRAAACSAV